MAHPSSSETATAAAQIWLHLPLSLFNDPEIELVKTDSKWTKLSDADSAQPAGIYTYFHSFVSDALWGNGTKARSNFKIFRREIGSKSFAADFVERISNADSPLTYGAKRVVGTVGDVELRIGRQSEHRTKGRDAITKPKIGPNRPWLAIVTIKLKLDQVATCDAMSDRCLDALDTAVLRDLRLADVQDALEWVRRIFPRWWTNDGRPGDTLSRMALDGMGPMNVQTLAEIESEFQRSGTLPLLPWITHLLKPIAVDGTTAAHFGDERCFMASSIALGPKELHWKLALDLFRTIPDGDLFRLAEADRAGGGGYNYQKPFLDALRDQYFYTRHAPDPEADRGNSTLFLTTQHHLCAIGTGWFAHNDQPANMDKYYRHMQFLCVFEYFRLIQFSQRLSELVARKNNLDTLQFHDALLAIREDFLTFTHLGHFTSVSSQLQAREIFSRISTSMGIADMYREIEAELRSATEYAALKDARDQAKRAEKLNDLVTLGVPAGLTLAVAGLAAVTGQNAPEVGWITWGGSEFSLLAFQFLVIGAVVFGLWKIFYVVIDRGTAKTSNHILAWIVAILAIAAVVVLGLNRQIQVGSLIGVG